MKIRTITRTTWVGAVALAASAMLVAGCGDDATGGDGGAGGDDSGAGGTASGGASGGSGSGTGGLGGDASGGFAGEGSGGTGGGEPVGPAPIVPITGLQLDNAINPYGVVFGSDGKIYVSGTTDVGLPTEAQTNGNLRLAVWRLNADGSVDDTWATLGKATSAIVNPGTSYDIVELADGSFVVHYAGSGGVSLVAMSAAGAFGDPVKVELGWSAADVAALDALADAAATSCGEDAESEQCAADTEAAQDVWPALTAPLFAERPAEATSWGMALDASGAEEKIVVFAAGPAASGTGRSDNDRHIVRVLASTFAVDPDFNDGEVFSLDPNGAELANNGRRGIVLEDGSIVSSGYTNYQTVEGGLNQNHVELIKLLPSGAVDPAFSFSESATGDTYAPAAGLAYFNPFPTGFAEAYGLTEVSSGTLVTTGYGVSNFDVTTIENDLVSFAMTGEGYDLTFGGNSLDTLFGSMAVQSEDDPNAGFGARPYRENGRDVVALADDRTVHVGCYDDAAAVFVLDEAGRLDASVGGGTGRVQYIYPFPFYQVALSEDGTRIVATASSRAKVTSGTGSYAKAFVALLGIEE